ncbi:MAG: ParB/RepB/Spo0J family partition protein [Oscillatoriaceae cyanobacterium]
MQLLITSIRERGILHPLVVRPNGDKYEIVCGERRYRSALEVGLTSIPVTVRVLTDAEALQCALMENLQRDDLNPIEETDRIVQLLSLRLGCTVAQVTSRLYQLDNQAKRKVTQSALGQTEEAGGVTQSALGNSDREIVEQVFAEVGRINWRSFVSTRLPLLKLPPEILEAIRSGRIEYTKAKEIAKLKSEAERMALLEEAIAKPLTLRELQKLVKEKKAPREYGEVEAEMQGISRRFSKFKAWGNSDKRQKIESLMKEMLEMLLSEEGE